VPEVGEAVADLVENDAVSIAGAFHSFCAQTSWKVPIEKMVRRKIAKM
jgi:hypothetical protein